MPGEMERSRHGGGCVSCLVQSQNSVVEAGSGPIGKMACFHFAMLKSEILEELASILTTDAPDGLTRVIFTNSGSDGRTGVMMGSTIFRWDWAAAKESYWPPG